MTYSTGRRVSNTVLTLCGDRWNYTYCGDHLLTYKNAESQRCTPEINRLSYVSYTSMKRKVPEMSLPPPITACAAGVRGPPSASLSFSADHGSLCSCRTTSVTPGPQSLPVLVLPQSSDLLRPQSAALLCKKGESQLSCLPAESSVNLQDLGIN